MNAQPLEWNDVHLVLAVCREGTLSGAARVLGVNHSTEFRRVGAIEQKLGVRLFERLATGYVMTEAGEAMLESGERMENEVLGLSRRLVGRDLHPEGIREAALQYAAGSARSGGAGSRGCLAALFSRRPGYPAGTCFTAAGRTDFRVVAVDSPGPEANGAC